MTQQRSQNDPITKQRVLLFAQQNGDAAAAEKLGIARSTVRGWRRQSKQGLTGYIDAGSGDGGVLSAKRKVASAVKAGGRVSDDISGMSCGCRLVGRIGR